MTLKNLPTGGIADIVQLKYMLSTPVTGTRDCRLGCG